MESKEVLFFKGSNGRSPMIEWLSTIPEDALAKFRFCFNRMQVLVV